MVLEEVAQEGSAGKLCTFHALPGCAKNHYCYALLLTYKPRTTYPTPPLAFDLSDDQRRTP